MWPPNSPCRRPTGPSALAPHPTRLRNGRIVAVDVRFGWSGRHSRFHDGTLLGTTGNLMNPIRSSLRDLDRLHPLIAGIIGGLISVALVVLLAPSELDRIRAWGLFTAIGAGIGIGRWLHFRAKGSQRVP